MSSLDRLVTFFLAAIMLVGGYQFYFWCQRHTTRPPRSLETGLDRLFRYRPGWVWMYGAAYYIVIFYSALTVPDMRVFNYFAFSYLILLGTHMVFFILLPVSTPAEWREQSIRKGMSRRFLGVLQKIDSPANCFPSMHVSVSTLTALHLHSNHGFGPWIGLFPFLIALSALYVKQHFVADIVPGAILGWAIFKLFEYIA